MDTTAVALTILDDFDDAKRHAVMDELLTYINDDGIMQVYADRSRPRTGQSKSFSIARSLNFSRSRSLRQRSHTIL